MKRFPKIFSAACAVVALSSSLALAAEAPGASPPPPGSGFHGGHAAHALGGPGMMGPLAQLSPEKQKAAMKLMEAHADAMFPLHQSLYAKHAELEALNASGEGESGKARSVIRDIADLNAKMLQENGKFRTRLFKETGLRVPIMGHGPLGGKGGKGCGMMGGRMGGMGPMMAPGGPNGPAPADAPVAGNHAGH